MSSRSIKQLMRMKSRPFLHAINLAIPVLQRPALKVTHGWNNTITKGPLVADRSMHIYSKINQAQQTKKETANVKISQQNTQKVIPGGLLSKNPLSSKVNDTLFTIPNMLTMSRIAATPFIGYFVIQENYFVAGSLFLYSCVTDFLDGYIARKFNMRSSAGTILDPAADKFLMLVTTLSFTLPPGPQIVPIGIALFIIGRDVALLINSMFVRYSSLKLTHNKISQSVFWDFYHHPSVEVKPTDISKWNTFFQMCYLGPGVILVLLTLNNENKEKEGDDSCTTEDSVVDSPRERPHWFTYFGYFVALSSVLSGLSYLGPAKYSKATVRFLK